MCDSKSLVHTALCVRACVRVSVCAYTYDILSLRHLNNIQNRQSNFLELYNKLEFAECVFAPLIHLRSGCVMNKAQLLTNAGFHHGLTQLLN